MSLAAKITHVLMWVYIGIVTLAICAYSIALLGLKNGMELASLTIFSPFGLKVFTPAFVLYLVSNLFKKAAESSNEGTSYD